MKKIAIVLLIIALSVCVLTACGDEEPNDQKVLQAISVLKGSLKTTFDSYDNFDSPADYYVEIKNVRIVYFKDNVEHEALRDIDYIVEFVLFGNQYSDTSD